MNVENFKLVREHVARNEEFHMENMRTECGTPACVMGSAEAIIRSLHAAGVLPEAELSLFSCGRYVDQIFMREWLGVNSVEFDQIFLGSFSRNYLSNIRKAEVLAYLDLCIERGEIVFNEFEWPRVCGEISMNIENFKLLRDHVAENSKFTMNTMTHSCGSAACIMGSAEAIILSQIRYPLGSEYTYRDENHRWRIDHYHIRAKWLDLSFAEYDHIYMGKFSIHENTDQVTQAEAVAFLDMCIESRHVFLGKVAFVPEEML
jgi:hypothetical protein